MQAVGFKTTSTKTAHLQQKARAVWCFMLGLEIHIEETYDT